MPRKKEVNATEDEKREFFCIEYLKDLSPQNAAIRAGYSARSAKSYGSTLKKDMQWRIDELMAERMQRTEVDVDYVVRELTEVVKNCKQGTPVYDMTGRQVTTRGKDGELKAVYKLDSKGATGALDLLGKHLGMYKDKVEVSGTVNIADVIKQARKRVVEGNSDVKAE